jgi:hypothetical protein
MGGRLQLEGGHQRINEAAPAPSWKAKPSWFLVITKEPWDVFFEGVEQLSDQFMGGERVQPELESRD